MSESSSIRPNPYLKANCFSVVTFWWLNRLLFKGFRKDLELEDIYPVLPEDNAKLIGDLLDKNWALEVERANKKNEKKKPGDKEVVPSLLKAIVRPYWSEYMKYGSIGFLEDCVLRTLQPVCLGFLINHLANKDKYPPEIGILFAVGVTLAAIGLVFTHHVYFLGLSHIGMKIRVSTSNLIFRKAMKLSQSALAGVTVGQFVNLMSNDVSRFETAAFNCNHFWIGPVQTIIATGILWWHFGPSCLAGIAVLLFFIPFQGYMGKLFSKLRAETALKTDKRIRLMNEVINGVRVIKLYAWEKFFAGSVGECRLDEIRIIRKTSTLRSINVSLFFASSKIIIFFTLLAYVLMGNNLDPEKVFVGLSLYNNIRLNMTLYLPNAISSFSEALVSLKRIQDILLMEEKMIPPPLEKASVTTVMVVEENEVKMVDFCGKWNFTYEENTLNRISFRVGEGEIMAIIGHVGSGKGSIVQAILNELPAIEGYVEVHGTLAYSAQEPWIFSGSVRDNILFGKPFDPDWYEEVIVACALKRDFTLLPYGDRSLVGDRGSSLSGGQKSRINLARAVYANADIYLLDDPLSAVDAEVGRHLFEKCINGILADKVRILVTHQLQFLKSLDHILLVNQGRIQLAGTYTDLLNSGIDFAKLLTTDTKASALKRFSNNSFYTGSGIGHSRAISDTSLLSGFSGRRMSMPLPESPTMMGLSYANNEILVVDEEPQEPSMQIVKGNSESVEFIPTTQEEITTSGSVKWILYWHYFRAGTSYFTLFILLFTNIITQILLTLSDYWLAVWTKHEHEWAYTNATVTDRELVATTILLGFDIKTTESEDLYIYSGLVVAVFVTSIIRTVLFFRTALASSITLHNEMLDGILFSPMSFFEANPTGRILNRFSASMGEIDDSLPPAFFYAIGILLSAAGIVVLVSAVNPILLAPAALLLIILYFLRAFYLRTARCIKRIEGITRSPVYSHLSSCLYGLSTIRAFNAEVQMTEQFEHHQNLHSSAWFLYLATTRWFGFWLDWISVAFISVVTFIFVMNDSDGATVGLVISSVIQLSGMLQWGIRQSAEVQNLMVSVEMVTQYAQLPSEGEHKSKPDKKPPKGWPDKGLTVMKDVYLKYGINTVVLDKITCTIYPSEKVGIVGRTGAGKSSLITVLFRLVNPEGDITIDGISTLGIGLGDLRRNLSIIPQEPALFLGTLRTNLDPFHIYTDSQIWDALQEVHLADEVKSTPMGLELEVSEGGSNFSVGQRQLVCLARAMLKQSKVLVLDEATANVDPETDIVIQSAIRKNFANCTVLTIAHRLNTVMDCDRILVLDAGKIKEFDEPYLLLQNKNSELYHLVEETGKDSARILYETAKTAMKKRHPDTPFTTPSQRSLDERGRPEGGGS